MSMAAQENPTARLMPSKRGDLRAAYPSKSYIYLDTSETQGQKAFRASTVNVLIISFLQLDNVSNRNAAAARLYDG